jgi:uncharacterized protein
MKKIPLEIIGLGYSQSQSGAYALIIQEKDGPRRIPIMIGNAEAQAIALELENFKTDRPFTHDLFHHFALKFEIELLEIIIYKFSKGIFFSLLVCKQGSIIHEIDSRTSDAVALALRFKCPMFTFEEILDAAGIYIDEPAPDDTQEKPPRNKEETDEDDDLKSDLKSDQKSLTKQSLFSYNAEELNEMLQSSIDNEEFEVASLIRDEIKRRKKK